MFFFLSCIPCFPVKVLLPLSGIFVLPCGQYNAGRWAHFTRVCPGHRRVPYQKETLPMGEILQIEGTHLSLCAEVCETLNEKCENAFCYSTFRGLRRKGKKMMKKETVFV
ncbi:hypothetical protein CEXT_542551 [Caerostris extrusa]|uniref:Secreted protein n=1 Tax=Caerostris extrusa TaxID=172846 RepID=A0AAV4W6Q2_CAEEX|nr:hypothetical protein CEXT_542551 [Caerostris extrusa]